LSSGNNDDNRNSGAAGSRFQPSGSAACEGAFNLPVPGPRRTISAIRDAVNRRSGDVTVVHLPELGIRGNTHFPFSDLNRLEIADLLSKSLKEKRLD
jgi:hypothetical protein